jgi:tetratricopeptide (TPR) repeat protein
VLPEGDVRRVTLLPDLADVLGDLGDFRGAERRLGEALGAARQRGDVRLEAEARLVALSVRFATEPESWNETSFAEVEAAIPTLEAAHDHRTLARAWHLLGSVHGTACRYASAERAVFEAMRHAGLAGDRRLRSRGITALTICAVYGPTPVPEAIERCETALLEAEEAKDRRAASIVRCTLAHLNAMRGGFEIARELYERARANLVDLGGTVLAASTSLDSGPVELLAGDLARAEAELRRDFDALAAVGETYLRSTISGLLAHTLLAAERREEADRFARAAEAMAADDDVESQVLWRTARARLHAEAGDPEAAISVARGAVDLILATENPNMQGNAFLDLARVLRVAGRHEEAAGVAARARAAFEAKGAVVSVRKAAALEELIAAG